MQKKFEEVLVELETVRGFADASKLMSAANTVKVADLENLAMLQKEALSESDLMMAEVDKLLTDVLMQHYTMIAESAASAIAALQDSEANADSDALSTMGEPIEIIAPDTSGATNSPAAE